jgi:molybdate transport system ATP-binding protein
VALGRAILRGPDLLLMDEPLAALDAPLKDRILTYLERALRQWQIPTIFVSHDQADVRRFAGSVVVLENGKVVASGPTATTLDRATMSRTFDGAVTGPVNLLRLDDVEPAGDHLVGRIGQQRLNVPGEVSATRNGPTYIQFLPRDVMLSRGDVAGLSARNHQHGRVREIVPLPHSGRVFVAIAIDAGQSLWAEVTPEAVKELNLAVDSPATCHIKSTAMSVLA